MKLSLREGLTKLNQLDIPHPQWDFVRGSSGLKRYYNLKDDCGWTIRSILEPEEHPNKKPIHVNRVYKADVPSRISQFQQALRGAGLFAVHPSWKSLMGGTLMLDKDKIIIEAAEGSVYKVLRGIKTDVTLVYSRDEKQPLFVKGEKELIPVLAKSKIFETADKLKDDNYILHWVITDQNKLMFYKLETLEDAQQRLKRKYSKE